MHEGLSVAMLYLRRSDDCLLDLRQLVQHLTLRSVNLIREAAVHQQAQLLKNRDGLHSLIYRLHMYATLG